jgi:hypothetical protein
MIEILAIYLSVLLACTMVLNLKGRSGWVAMGIGLLFPLAVVLYAIGAPKKGGQGL